MMALLENIERTAFLGEEFLTWLWFRSETGPRIKLAGLGQISVEMGQPLVLRGSEDQDAVQVSIRGERASVSHEARAALRQNKKLYKCKVTIKKAQLSH